jgi:hypothetical protein
MWAPVIKEFQVAGNRDPGGRHRLIRMQVHLFVLHAPPQAFNENVGVRSQLRRLATIRVDVFG